MKAGRIKDAHLAIEEAINIHRHMKNISMQHRDESINWLYVNYSRLPMPHEKE
jgi:hypothetical protein